MTRPGRDYLYMRNNPKGVLPSAGCIRPAAGAGSTSYADTASHRIIAVYRIGSGRPPVNEAGGDFGGDP